MVLVYGVPRLLFIQSELRTWNLYRPQVSMCRMIWTLLRTLISTLNTHC